MAGDNVGVLLQWGLWRNIPVLEQTAVHRGKEENERFSEKQENRNENTFQAEQQSLWGQ